MRIRHSFPGFIFPWMFCKLQILYVFFFLLPSAGLVTAACKGFGWYDLCILQLKFFNFFSLQKCSHKIIHVRLYILSIIYADFSSFCRYTDIDQSQFFSSFTDFKACMLKKSINYKITCPPFLLLCARHCHFCGRQSPEPPTLPCLWLMWIVL